MLMVPPLLSFVLEGVGNAENWCVDDDKAYDMTMLIIPSGLLANASSVRDHLLNRLPCLLVGGGADGIKHISILCVIHC